MLDTIKPNPAWADPQYLTTDLVLFTIKDEALNVLLRQRAQDPFKGHWTLPGGFVHTDESLEKAASRLLRDKIGVDDVYLEQLFTFGDTLRGPELRVVTTAYVGVVHHKKFPASLFTSEWKLFPAQRLPKLGFDHDRIMEYALERLRHKINYTTIVHELLEKAFTLSDLQQVYEIILNQKMDKRNFRKKMLLLGILKDLASVRKEATGRPARLYGFARRGIVKLQERGVLVPF
jgi:8-oxo-dGTP diphosphatase